MEKGKEVRRKKKVGRENKRDGAEGDVETDEKERES